MKKLKKNTGITLIALVISIIVMLILAGVSLNATLGDNGIITRAQETNYVQSVAVLEEYLNQFYTANYENLPQDENKAIALSNYSASSNWFLKTANGYLVDKNGKAHCFLIIENMPSEVSESVVGGRGEGKELGDYIAGNDVYGVTSDLKVYYCRNGIDSGIGYAYDDLPFENPEKVVFPANSAWAKLINGDGEQKDLTVADMKSVTNLEITETSGISSLADLYNFTSLKSITLRNITMDTLDGLDNARDLQYLYMENINVADYKAMSKLTKLQALYVERNGKTEEEDNNAVKNMFNAIAGVDYPSLANFGIFGNNDIDRYLREGESYYNTSKVSNVSNISGFNNLSTTTKEAIRYLYLNANRIVDFSSLAGLKNVITLRLEYNLGTNLNFIEKMTNLEILYIPANQISDITVFENNTFNKLYHLNLRNNAPLINIKSVINLKALSYLYLLECPSLNILDVQEIADFYNARQYKSIDSKYNDYLQGSTKRVYDGKSLTDTSSQITSMQAMNLEDKQKVKQISLMNNPNLTDTCLNNLLSSGFTNLVSLDLTGCTKLTNLDFLENLPNLQELIIVNTGVVGDEVKEIDDHCPKIATVSINTKVNLTSMQNSISRMYSNARDGNYCKGTGIKISADLVPQLANCTNITKLSTYGMAKCTTSVDLSNCNKLTDVSHISNSTKFILPESVINIYIQSGVLPTVTKCANKIQTINMNQLDHTNEDIKAFFEQLSNSTSLKTITLTVRYNIDFSALNILSKSSVKSITMTKNPLLSGKITTAKNIDFRKDDSYVEGTKHFDNLTQITISDSTIESLDAFKDCTHLTDLIITNAPTLTDITALENMPNLTTVNLSGDSITSLHGLRNATHLQTLNLNNNSVYNSIYDNKVKQQVDNIEILKKLNSHSLQNLYLLNNKIDDFSELNKLKFTNKSW